MVNFVVGMAGVFLQTGDVTEREIVQMTPMKLVVVSEIVLSQNIWTFLNIYSSCYTWFKITSCSK